MRRLSLYAASLALALFATQAVAVTEAGFRVETFTDKSRSRPIMLDWWYPAPQQAATEFNYGLGRGRVVEAGKVATGKFPLILMSHGAFGSARNYSWIAEHLARNGYLVAGVSHYGESYVYGADTIDPQAVLRWWERPLDISAALTFIEQKSALADVADFDRIGFMGHSSGGATAMSLLGAGFDTASMGDYCLSSAALADRGCDYARSGTASSEQPVPPPARTNYADGRIRAYVALDPALGPGFVDFTAINPTIRVLLAGSVHNDFLPQEHHAQHLAERLPNVTHHWLSNQEGHFVYLNECELSIEANGVPLCTDRPGVLRAAVHARLSRQISGFFAGELSRSAASTIRGNTSFQQPVHQR